LAFEGERRRKYNERLKLLRQIDRAILSVRSVNEIAEAALARFQELVPCQRASVALFEPDGTAKLVGVVAASGTALGIGSDIPLIAFGNIEDLRQGKPLVVENIADAPDTPPRRAIEADGIRSLICLPLLANRELVGTLNLGFASTGAFSCEHVEIAQEVSDSLAVAIRQAHLNAQVQRHADELEQRVVQRTAELSEANQKLQESRERIRSLYDNTPIMMHSLDQQGRVIEVNEHWLRTLGYTRDEVIGQPVVNFAAPESRGPVQEVLIPRLAREGFIKDAEVQGLKKNGDVIDLLVSSVVKKDANGNFLYSQTSLLDITEQRRAQRESVYLQEQLASELNFEEIVGASPSIQKVFSSIEMVAQTDATVLLLGETGTGKELIARAVHNRSRRKQSVMVKVNCGALPANLVESELFGHEKGAFTGAVAQKKGRFELAHRGSIFLDEIGELPIETQTKLLRALQEQEFERVGGSQTVKVDVRVIAATNRDLEDGVRGGAFRADLFYRLNVFPIEVPPLRERKNDIPLLANYFVRKFSQRMGKRVENVHKSVYDQFHQYDWPGNVRELANLLERAVILCQGDTLQPQHLTMGRSRQAAAPDTLPTLEEGERRLILRALEQTGGILAGPSGAAELLGINRSTLWSRMRKLGIEPPKIRRVGAGRD
jgi:PAS domain S-box-containing protein